MTNPAWRAGTNGSANGVTSFSVTVPSGVQADDLCLVFVTDGSSTNTVSPPSDGTWTTVFQNSSGSYGAYGLFWHKASASEPASWTFTSSASVYPRWVSGAWSGADVSGTPINAYSNNNVALGSTSINLTAVSPTVANATLAAFVVQETTTGSITVDSSMTSRVAATSSYHENIADQSLTSTGSTGTRTFSNSSNSAAWFYAMVAIAPAPPPPVETYPAGYFANLPAQTSIRPLRAM